MNTARKSTTHDERYYHIKDAIEIEDRRYIKGYKACTVFMRKEQDGWYVSIARCSEYGNFCKRQGRSIAHRKYFQGKCFKLSDDAVPNYDTASAVYMDVEIA